MVRPLSIRSVIPQHFACALSALALVACEAASPAPAPTDTSGGSDTAGEADVGPSADAGTPEDASFDVGGTDAALGDVAPGDDVGVDAVTDAEDDAAPDGGFRPQICGNGTVEEPEVCDDGNRRPGDGCNATCTSDETCGNAIVDLGEQCDDGNLEPGDGCDALCRNEEGCGNGIVERGEACDDGNTDPGDGCSPLCTREVFVATDLDGDTISDFDEGFGTADTDGDGELDTEDLDSDDDGIPDSVEAGDDDLISPPVDTDLDGVPDFRDLDSDADGIADEVEGSEDVDGDGYPNSADLDSDGDYVPDAVEGRVDSDGDGVPDFLDVDSDEDTILDEHELFADSDGDGQPNRIDLDSDADGRLDGEEAGDDDPETFPFDFDGDGLPDYIDADADDDGVPDEVELGCAVGASEPTSADTDGDGFSDLAESTIGSDPCNATAEEEFEELTDFYFILPPGGPEQDAPLEFATNITQADVSIAMDTTGSMSGEIDNLRAAFSGSIVVDIAEEVPNVGFAITTFDDFPCDGHGDARADTPFTLLQRVTTNIGAAQAAINGIPLHFGADAPESGYESMYQTATGAGITHCGADVPPFNPSVGFVPGEAEGTIGGVGFREGSFPVVIHVTDQTSHEGSVYGGPAASSTDAINALRGIQARLVGVASSNTPRAQLVSVAQQTDAQVPTCAWDGARPAGCGASQCCTGVGGSGRAPTGGTCPLVFDINSDGSGLNTAITTAVRALVNTSSFVVSTEIRPDPVELARSGFDTTCFVRSVTPASYIAEGGCTSIPTLAGDRFLNVTPGTALFFDVVAENDGCWGPSGDARAFTVYIDVVGDELTVLDTQRVTVVVPAIQQNPSTIP